MEAKVLVACPIWSEDAKWVDEFIKSYEGYDILFVDNTRDTDGFYKHLLSLGVNAIRHEWNPRKTYLLDMLGDCCNEILDYAIKNDYTHWLWTNPDIVPPKDAINKLLRHEKDVVGFPTNMYSVDGPPAVFKDTTLFWSPRDGCFMLKVYQWEELERMKDQLLSVYGIGGVALYSQRVMKTCRFRHPSEILWGEDLWWYVELKDKGFDIWCDASERANNRTGLDRFAVMKTQKHCIEYIEGWKDTHPKSFYEMMLPWFRMTNDGIPKNPIPEEVGVK